MIPISQRSLGAGRYIQKEVGFKKKKKKKRKLGAQENKITNIYDLVKFDPDPLWGPSSNLSAHVGSPVHPPPA